MASVYMPGLPDSLCRHLDSSLKSVTQEIRQILANHDIGNFHFKILANGRTAAGDAKMSYSLSEHGYDPIEARAVKPMIEEFLRRKGFDLVNAPLELPAPGRAAEDEEPF